MSTMAPPRLRLAVIGTGLGSTPHFQSLQDLSAELEVGWIQGSRADAMASRYGLKNARKAVDVSSICNDKSIAAVLVLTPPNTHLEVVQALALAGKHVLVEKPLEITLPKATELVEACERAGVLLAVMLKHRMRPAALALTSWPSSPRASSPVSASASVRWWRPQSYYDEPGRGTLARDGGGVLITQAIHTLDLLLGFTGFPQRVTAITATSPVHCMEGEDHAAALLQWPGGAVGVVQASTAAYPGYPERIELNGTLGTATLEAGSLKASFINGNTLEQADDTGSGGGADPMAFDHAPHRAVLEDFANAVRENAELSVSGRSALQVHRLIAAMMESSRKGEAVLPLA
jgi:UDP-N-acetyl-2-amino-2-deoxyglucuronate dehydrogenase